MQLTFKIIMIIFSKKKKSNNNNNNNKSLIPQMRLSLEWALKPKWPRSKAGLVILP